MGKNSKEENDQQHQSLDLENSQSSLFLCCSCCSSLSRLFSLRCLIVLLLSFVILLSAIFWLFPHRSLSEYDADEIVKLTASVQACFRLKRPASEVIVYKGRLEKDIFKSIDYLQNTKVTIMSLHQSVATNYTDVEFAVLPVSTDYTLRKDLLSSLRTSFVNLFAQRLNLNLTTSSLGKPSTFQVLKFPGGITVDPLSDKPVSGVVEILFNFTLDYSISEIQDRLSKLKDQLEIVLRLETYESVHFQLTNEEGSTISPPVIVQAYVVSTMRDHIQQRLNHLAQIIQTSSGAKNLGLDNSVFGEVKSISFSTYLEGKILDSALVLAPSPTSCFPSLC